MEKIGDRERAALNEVKMVDLNVKNKKSIRVWIEEEVFIDQIETEKQFPNITQIKVLQQYGGMLCGFHCYHNVKCFLNAILGDE